MYIDNDDDDDDDNNNCRHLILRYHLDWGSLTDSVLTNDFLVVQ